MPNVGGPSFMKRKTLMNVVIFIIIYLYILYAAPVWGEKALSAECNRVSLSERTG